MAPIEPNLFSSNLKAISIFAGYLALAAGVTGFIAYRNIYQAYRSLPPSQATRKASSKRHIQVQIFSGLAVASLAIAWYHLLNLLTLSYRAWAHGMDQPIPTGLWTHRGILGEQPTGLALGQWLQDTSLFVEAWEIVVERSRRYWWSQQIFLVAAAWSVFVGLEGRKRNIYHLWTFVLLGQLVAISFAMNLFFLTILLTPVPLPRRGRSTLTVGKSRPSVSLTFSNLNHHPRATLGEFFAHTIRPYLLTPFLGLFYLTTFLVPFSTQTPSFLTLLLLAHVLLFPVTYLASSPSPTIPHTLPLWRLITVLSTVLHAKQTLVSLLDSDPGAYTHRHSSYLATLHLPHVRARGPATRSVSAVGRVLGALNDHPAVASVGWDVLMCAVSLAVWSVVRGLELGKVGEIIGVGRGEDPAGQGEAAEQDGETIATSRPRRRTRGRRTSKKNSAAVAGENDDDDDATFSDVSEGDSTAGVVEDLDRDPDYEAGAASWGIFTVAGLGTMAAGVLGAEAER